MATTEVNDRIKALLAKAQATEFEAEAEAFFTKAYALMLKHGIAEDDLVDKDMNVYVRQELFIPGKYGKQKQIVAWDIAQFFGCYLLANTPRNFNGTRSQYKLYVFGSRKNILRFAEMVNELWWWGEVNYNRTPGRREQGFMTSYWQAYGDTLAARLRETVKKVEEEEEMSLLPILMSDAKRANQLAHQMHSNITHTSYSSSYNSAGAEAGRQAGRNANLHSGNIGASAKKGLNS
jgi:hypothetical protein